MDVRDAGGLTPLHHAAVSGNDDAVAWLLAQGTDPAARTRWNTQAHDAALKRLDAVTPRDGLFSR